VGRNIKLKSTSHNETVFCGLSVILYWYALLNAHFYIQRSKYRN